MIDRFLKFLILYSVGMYLFEMISGTQNSLEGHVFFLWSERIVAAIFTLEIFWRMQKERGAYIWSVMYWIDVLAIFPFWLGFGAPVKWLGIVRTLRVLRLLKFFRYSRGLQLVALGFYKAGAQLKYLAFPVLVAVIFSTVAMYEAEHLAQPESFSNLFKTFWFTMVTVTTVGYGDMSPITIPGQMIAMVTFLVVLSLFAGALGVMGSSMSKVLDDETDSDFDPIELHEKQRSSVSELPTKEKSSEI